jgi:hypothetical protein
MQIMHEELFADLVATVRSPPAGYITLQRHRMLAAWVRDPRQRPTGA